MRTGRPKQALILTEEERDRLQSMAHRARSQPLLARRARLVLACGDGLDNQAVARKLRGSESGSAIQSVPESPDRYHKLRLCTRVRKLLGRNVEHIAGDLPVHEHRRRNAHARAGDLFFESELACF